MLYQCAFVGVLRKFEYSCDAWIWNTLSLIFIYWGSMVLELKKNSAVQVQRLIK